MKPRISVVINTLNEEINLPYLLRSVCTWVDEIIVVDMHSEDRTIEIAREFGAKVHFHERLGVVEGARAFAVAQATGEWVLLLDADEMITRPLSAELLQIATEDSVDVVILPWLNYLLGDPLRHSGWGPHQDRHPRFFRRGSLDMSPQIHGGIHLMPQARVLTLPPDNNFVVHHFNYQDSEHFLQKLNRYTTIEAEQAFARGEHANAVKATLRAASEFAYRYVYKRGFRDGWRGFYLSGFMAMYRFSIHAKLQDIHSNGGKGKIAEKYHRIAEELIADFQTDHQHLKV